MRKFNKFSVHAGSEAHDIYDEKIHRLPVNSDGR